MANSIPELTIHISQIFTPCGNTLAADASGSDSSPGRGTLVDDSSFQPLTFGKMSTSFCWGLKSPFSHGVTSYVLAAGHNLIQKMPMVC